MESDHPQTRRVRVEQGIYLQPNGKYAVCFMAAGRPRFRTVGYDIGEDSDGADSLRRVDPCRRAPGHPGVSASPGSRDGGSSAMSAVWKPASAVSARSKSNRYHLERHLLPALGPRLIRTIDVEDVATLMTKLRAAEK